MDDPAPIPLQEPALHKLPVEIIQEIASYLSKLEKASFCLSSRFTCYAVGTQELHTLLRHAYGTKFDRRANNRILERAFPSHWFCAWCDKFHRHDRAGGPLDFDRETPRECAQFNSFLRCGPGFTLAYHHVRLAMNRHFCGPEYGIPLDDFTYSSKQMVKILRANCQMETITKARIVANQFLLHAACTVTIPLRLRPQRDIASEITKAMPQVVVGHRSKEHGHKDLVGVIQRFLSMMPPQDFFQSEVNYCGQCSTDYQVTCRYLGPLYSDLRTIEIMVEVWRNLGVGKSPFDALWRAHGETQGQKVVGKAKTWSPMDKSEAGVIKEAFQKEGELERLGQFGTLQGNALVLKSWG
ncbi:uncharacterized protein BDZ99DRAFT_464232 [Mytilinidion resinicola]|uniref:F-box domain-containing protein n=1 Tax=Mytilinidion resinicola TaxID=574789 RepID=A0A6A6YHS4_9PEZI|nr:uncharacterized protein BDZ99DRAFT_464232 [Mytilinidion resinicola]KAF2808351.1 hypothetical protein BDZ99DRAFT_464232 [Mytilinidion resinicola]